MKAPDTISMTRIYRILRARREGNMKACRCRKCVLQRQRVFEMAELMAIDEHARKVTNSVCPEFSHKIPKKDLTK